MNPHILGVIIGREYTTRVKKKSFIILTFVVPILFAALCIIPSLIMAAAKEDSKKIALIDDSGLVMPYLEDNDVVTYSDYSGQDADSVKASLSELGMDALVHVSELDTVSKSVTLKSYSKKPLGLELTSSIEDKANDAIEDYRVASYDIEDLATIMENVKSDVSMTTYTLDDSGKESISSSEVYMLVSMLLGIIIYMFIAMFSGTVMNSVIEEKSSRVVEVLVSSVKATELLFGKIIGVALVALTQFFMWVVLTLVLVSVLGGIIGFDKVTESAATADPTAMKSRMGVDPEALEGSGMTMDISALTAAADTVGTDVSPMSAVMTTLAGLNYAEIIVSFLIYFIFGYLLYASMYAAIGSAVENEADTQQLQIPVTIPLLIGFFIAFYAFKAPESGVVFWGSMIPFTSPIVMLARIPYGVPLWQLIVSIALLIGTFALFAWASAKIYKVGILMFGKKSTFKDLWKWFKQD